jgi:periplasmic protein TonB
MMNFKNYSFWVSFLTLSFLMMIFTHQIYSFTIESNPLPGDEEYAAFAEEMPSPVGGMPAIIKQIAYPASAKKANIEGKVFVLAFINEKGGVDNVKVLKGIGGGCDEAAIEAVSKSKFNPGKNAGTAIKVKLSLTITFKIS